LYCTHYTHEGGRERERERRNGEEARGYGDEVLSLFLSFFLFLPRVCRRGVEG